MQIISIVVPIYNEEKTLEDTVARVLKANTLGLEKEILLIDDCSDDLSWELAMKIQENHSAINCLQHESNKGKGSALKPVFQKQQEVLS